MEVIAHTPPTVLGAKRKDKHLCTGHLRLSSGPKLSRIRSQFRLVAATNLSNKQCRKVSGWAMITFASGLMRSELRHIIDLKWGTWRAVLWISQDYHLWQRLSALTCSGSRQNRIWSSIAAISSRSPSPSPSPDPSSSSFSCGAGPTKTPMAQCTTRLLKVKLQYRARAMQTPQSGDKAKI